MRGGGDKKLRPTALMAEGHEIDDTPGTQEKPLRPRQCNKYLQKELAREFRAIVQGFLKEAQKGSCAHMKLTVELLEPAKDDGGYRKGSAQRLLEELRGGL